MTINSPLPKTQRILHIDGLRAIAVIAVVLFHAFPERVPGGYIGVDYFLVISGYVIGKKYLFETSSVSWRRFWSRRIIRLYPQLLACIILCTPFALLLLQADLLENFFQSALASVLGVNNFLLLLTGGYWNISNEFKPLFPTWSLGLEQQFYLMISILLISPVFIRKIKSLLFILGFLTVGSFFLCSAWSESWPEANYLLLPSRIWEFTIGIFAAYFTFKYSSNSITGLPKWLSPISLAVVISFLVLPIQQSNTSPNPLLLLPLAALTAVIIDSPVRPVQRCLSIEPLVYIGLASYAIYLYHQPLFSFARVSRIDPLSASSLVFLVVLSFALGIIMYELVESRRFKHSSLFLDLKSSKPILFASTAIATFSLWGVQGQGWFSQRFPHLLINGSPPEGFLGGKGYTDYAYKLEASDFDSDQSRLRILFIGNSKVRDLVNSFRVLQDNRSFDASLSYLYSFNFQDNQHIKLINEADLVFTMQDIDQKPFPNTTFVSVRDRERFAYNINPIIFEKSPAKRSALRQKAEADIAPLLDYTKENGFVLRPIQAFLDDSGLKKLADSNGNLLTFDGIHLSKAGAEKLATELYKHPLARKILRLE